MIEKNSTSYVKLLSRESEVLDVTQRTYERMIREANERADEAETRADVAKAELAEKLNHLAELEALVQELENQLICSRQPE